MKKIYLFFIILLLTGCSKSNYDIKIETIIENKNQYKIGINYPKTGLNKLDKEIEKYINNTYKNFTKNKNNFNSLDTLDELNIDYTFYKNKNIISITIFKEENKNKEITTYNYDYKKNKFITIDEFVDSGLIYLKSNTILFNRYGNIININKIKENLNNKLFSIDNEYLYLYYPIDSITDSYNEIIIIDIPLKDLNIKSEITKKTSTDDINNKIDIEKVNKIIDTNSKIVALTFDDGPSIYTKEIIEILKENDVVATFFILGNKVELYKDTLKLSLEYGNEIGNHTYNHKWLTKLNDTEIKKQIEDTQNIIKNNLGVIPKLFRPSYGSINKRVRKDINLDIVLWNIDTMDWKYKNIDKIVDRAVKNTKDGDIILMHETYKRTKDSLEKIISILKDKDFSFVTISELKEIQSLRKQNEY